MFKTFTAVKEPRLSAKMLCEYAEASALTRATIIKDCKFHKPFISARYNDAEEFATEYFSKAIDYPETLKRQGEDLKKKSLNLLDETKAKNALACSYALGQLFKMSEQLDIFRSYILRAEDNKSRKMKLGEVQISIRPELMICDNVELNYCGFIKFYFGKTKPLTKTIAENMACLGKYYFKHQEGLDFNSKQCFVIDVCANRIYTAPKTFKRTIAQLEACCFEIKDRWDRI